MGQLGLILRRSRAGLGLVLTILLLSAATIAIIAGTLGYGQAASTMAARQTLTDAVPTEAGIQMQARITDEPDQQDAVARELLNEIFAPTPVSIQRTVVSEPRAATDLPGRIIAWSSPTLTQDDDRFESLVSIEAGTWPNQAGGDQVPVAVHTGSATAWGLDLGDTFTTPEATFEVTALWEPVDASAAFWFGDPSVITGVDGNDIGPVIAPPDSVGSLGTAPFVRWTLQPDAEQIGPDDMAALAAAAASVQQEVRGSALDVRGVTVDGDLAPTAAAAARNLAMADALGVVPIILLLLVSVIAIVQIGRMQSAARSTESELLVARGAGRAQLFTWTTVESVIVGAVATGLGIAVAWAALQLVPGGDQQTQVVIQAGLLTGIAVVAALVGITIAGLRQIGAGTSDRSGRTRNVAALGTLSLTLGAAGLTWWQLNQYGSPLVSGPDGPRTDLIAGAAPAMMLAAGAIIAMALLGPIARAVEWWTRRRRGIPAHLSSSQVSRRLVVYAVPVVLTVLAVGAATFSGTYAASSADLRDNLRAVGQGPDIRATTAGGPLVTGGGTLNIPDPSPAAGVSAWAPVWLADGRVGSVDVRTTMLPIDQLEAVTDLPEDAVDIAAITAALSGPTAGPSALAIPADASSVILELQVDSWLTDTELEGVQGMADLLPSMVQDHQDGAEAGLEEAGGPMGLLRALFAIDPTGGAVTVGFTALDPVTGAPLSSSAETIATPLDLSVDPRTYQVSAARTSESASIELDLPDSVHDLGLENLTLEVHGTGVTHQVEIVISGVRTDTGVELSTDWSGTVTPPQRGDSLARQNIAAQADSLTVDHDGDQVRVTATIPPLRADVGQGFPIRLNPDRGGPAATVVPAAITTGLAQSNNLEVGDPLAIAAFGTSIPAEVAVIVPGLPGTLSPSAVLVDSTSVFRVHDNPPSVWTAPHQLWVASDDVPATLDALGVRSEIPGIETVTGPGSVEVTDAASSVQLVFWVVALGTVVLAITGIGAVATTLARVRRPEVAVLRALGMTPRAQAGARAAELLGVIAAAVGVGLLAGWGVGALVVPDLARSTTDPGLVELPVALALDVLRWGLVVGVLLIALSAVALALATRVRRQALDRNYREEIR